MPQQVNWDATPSNNTPPPVQVEWDTDKTDPLRGEIRPTPSAIGRFYRGIKAGLSNANDPYVKADRAKYHVPDTITVGGVTEPTDPDAPAGWSAIPGSGVVRDIRSGNYAGAAGRILGPAAAVGSMFLGRGESPVEGAVRPINVRGPGEIAPEIPRAPRAYSPYERSPIAKPIPPRQGLLLEGAVNPGAHLPETPAPELLQSGSLREGGKPASPQPSSALAHIKTTPREMIQAEPIGVGGKSAPPPPSAALRNIPVKAEPIETGAAPTGAPASANIRKPGWTPPRASQFNPIEIGGPEDVAETRAIQEKIRDQAEQETDALRKRGNEEGFARNTRPRTPKSELTKQFQAGRIGKPSAAASGKALPAPGSDSAADDLTEEWQKNVDYLKTKKAKKK